MRISVLCVVALGAACTPTAFDSETSAIEFADGAGFALVQSDETVVAARSHNSTSGNITADRIGNIYIVTFEDLADEGGVAQVVAHGSDDVRCKVRLLAESGDDLQVMYLCHDSTGTEQASGAVVQYYRGPSSASSLSAYVFANDESFPFTYCPNQAWNSETVRTASKELELGPTMSFSMVWQS